MPPYFQSKAFLLTLGLIAASVAAFSGWQLSESTLHSPSPRGSERAALSTIESELDTTEWQSYRDPQGRFEMSYPKGWTLLDLPDPKAGFVLRSPAYKEIREGYVVHKGEIYVTVFRNDRVVNMPDFIRLFDDTAKFWPDQYQYTDISNDDYKGILFDRINEGAVPRAEAFLDLDGYVLSVGYLFRSEDPEIREIFDAILRSLHRPENP